MEDFSEMDYTKIKNDVRAELGNYFYQETGLEIYTTSHKNYYFNFKNNMQLHKVINDLLKNGNYREIKTDDYKGKKILGDEKVINNIKKKSYHVNDK